MPRKKVNPEDIDWDAVVKYYHDGHTYKDCKAKFGISMKRIGDYFKDNNIKRRAPLEPSNKVKAARAQRPMPPPPLPTNTVTPREKRPPKRIEDKVTKRKIVKLKE